MKTKNKVISGIIGSGFCAAVLFYMIPAVNIDSASFDSSVQHTVQNTIATASSKQTTINSISEKPHHANRESKAVKTLSAHDQEIVENSSSISEGATLSPIERIRSIQHKTALHQSLLSDHEEFNRYPANNRRFTDAQKDPVLKQYAIDERTTFSEEGDAALTIWSDQKYYLHEQTASLFAQMSNAHGELLSTEFWGQLIYNEREDLGVIEFKDEDRDGTYETQLTLEQNFAPGVYKVIVVNKQNELADALAFVLSQPEASLTGNFKNTVTANGNLLVQAELNVQSSNRYHIQAALYTLNDEPIGTSQYSADLKAGTHWLPIEFHGLMIHDSDEPGPYILKHIALSKVAMPMETMPISTPDYVTERYDLSQFSRELYAAQ